MFDPADRPTWTKVTFGDVVNHIKDRVPDVTNCSLTEYVRGEHFEPGNLRLIDRSTLGDGKHGSAFHMRFRPGDVLYVSRNPQLRKAAVADFEGICANTTYVCRADEKYLLQDLLPFIMQTESFVEYTIRHKRGSTNFYLNWSDIAGYEFALPPLEEQRRIGMALGLVESCLQLNLEAQLQLRTVEVATINHWIDSICQQGRSSVPLSELVLEKPSYGLNAPATEFQETLPRYLRITDIDDDGNLSKEGLVSVEVDDPAPYRIKSGDILFARTGTVGKVYLATGREGNTVYAGYLIRFALNTDLVNPQYVFAYTRSSYYWSWIRRTSRPGVQSNINAQEYGEMPIWLPRTRDDQEVLVGRFMALREAQKALSDRFAKLVCLKKMTMTLAVPEGSDV